MKRFLLAALIVIVSLGCKVGPDYKRPKIAVPPQHRGEEAPVAPDAAAGKSLGDLAWFDVFQDPALQELIRTGMRQNYDLLIAAARVDEARARLRITRADQYPTVGASAGAGLGRVTENGAIPLPPGASSNTSFNAAGVGLAWELDFWGKFRRASEAARAELLGTEEARFIVLQSLVTDIARAYFELRELDLELQIARDTLDSRRKSMRLVRLRQERVCLR